MRVDGAFSCLSHRVFLGPDILAQSGVHVGGKVNVRTKLGCFCAAVSPTVSGVVVSLNLGLKSGDEVEFSNGELCQVGIDVLSTEMEHLSISESVYFRSNLVNEILAISNSGKSVLIEGTGGSGKSVLLRQFAGEYVKGYKLLGGEVGEGEAKVLGLLELPGLLLIDDIDQICRSPGIMSALAFGMHGKGEVIACTGRPLDIPVYFKECFDVCFTLPALSLSERSAVLEEFYTKSKQEHKIRSIPDLAKRTNGFSLSDLLVFADSDEIPVPETGFKSLDQLGGISKTMSTLEKLFVQPLLHHERYSALGVRSSRGCVLYGRQGCGKTTIAVGLAELLREKGLVNAVEVLDSTQVVSKIVGQSEMRLKEFFAKCRRRTPCALVIDQLENLASPRSMGDSSGAMDRLLSSLLVELDGIVSGDASQILIIATTSDIKWLDPAILRPGRLDQHILVPELDLQDRADIWEKLLPSDANIDVQLLAELTEGYTPVELENCYREAAMSLLREDIESYPTDLHMRHFPLRL